MPKILFVLIFIISGNNLMGQENIRFPNLLPVGQQAPDWNLMNSKKDFIKLSDFKGKIVLLDFWASWCAPCIRAQPTLESIHQNYKNVVVLGINIQEGKDIDLESYKNKNALNYELIKGSEEMAKDYRVEVLPVVYLIDENGIILYAGFGYNEKKKAEIIEVIETQK